MVAVDDKPILNEPWPPDVDPADVPFRKRSATVLRRMGYFDDPSLFTTLTESEVLSLTNAGPRTVADIRITGNEAIRRHNEQVAQLPHLQTDMAVVAAEPWARHVWHRDPRFAEFLPKADATVYDIATSGSLDLQRFLWDHLDGLRAAIGTQGARTVGDAVAEYIEAISAQHGDRLEALLAQTGLGGQDPITNREMARRLGVSDQRASQIVRRLWYHRDRCRPPAGVWMPQVVEAERGGWPVEYTGEGWWRRGGSSHWRGLDRGFARSLLWVPGVGEAAGSSWMPVQCVHICAGWGLSAPARIGLVV